MLGGALWLGLRSKAVALDEQIERRLDTLAEMNVVASKLGELEKVKREMSVRVNGARGQLLDVPEDKAAERRWIGRACARGRLSRACCGCTAISTVSRPATGFGARAASIRSSPRRY